LCNLLDINTSMLTMWVRKYGIQKNIHHEPFDKSCLEFLYVNLNMTFKSLAHFLDVSPGTLYKWLKLYGIEKSEELKQEIRKKYIGGLLAAVDAKRLEPLCKESLEFLYLDLDLSTRQLAHLCDVDHSVIGQWLRNYGISKSHDQIIAVRNRSAKRNCIKRHGVSNVGKLDSVKQKRMRTSTERYGGPYGGFSIPGVIQKGHDTFFAKYGVTSNAQIGKSAEWIRIRSSKEKFEEYLKSFEKKPTVRELGEKFDINPGTMCGVIKDYDLREYIAKSVSEPELELQKLFPDAIFNDREILKPYELDLYFPDINFAIEFNGYYWHSLPKAQIKDEYKRKKCRELGIQLVQIAELDWLESKSDIIDHLQWLIALHTKK